MFSTTDAGSADFEQTSISALQGRGVIRILRFILRRFFTILLTIVLGVFLTVVIANHTGMIDKIVRNQVASELITIKLIPNFDGNLQVEQQHLESINGLSLSFLPKHLVYTYKALIFDWGDVVDQRKFKTWINTSSGIESTVDTRTIIFTKLPYTLLLSGIAYLLLILLGIPLALYLSQHEGRWLDRVVGILTPLSSIPSWIIGILLVLVFAAELKWLPPGKLFDNMPPQTVWGTITQVAYHLILPVMAIVLSLIFQLIYNWRTYLLIYSSEDYVTLAKAKGLNSKVREFQYILRPALPYMVTNLALTLVGFWQMISALEFFFQWPGIGKLFVDALPNFHSENMYSGEMGIVVGIVVLFAYILGITVFMLDFVYLIVDPRLRFEKQEQSVDSVKSREKREKRLISKHSLDSATNLSPRSREKHKKQAETLHLTDKLLGLKQKWQGFFKTLHHVLHEINRVPAARLGLALASFLVVVSILVLIFIPYNPVGKLWTQSNLTGDPTVAKLALPKWVNWFRKTPLPSTIVLDSQNSTVIKQISRVSTDISQEQFDFSFDYPYQDFPSEIALYLSTSYIKKMPFLALTWITPDGREIQLKNTSVTNGMTYPFMKDIPSAHLVAANPNFQNWFVTSGNQTTPDYYLLFADPAAAKPTALPGKYTLRLNGTVFEKDSNLNASLVVFGRVEGWAGTDYLRRDLVIPLLWGLPFALLIGVVGAAGTSLISLILAAAAAWLGGWVDYLVQRATEANLILPVMAIGVLLYSYYNLSLWLIIGLIILANVLGSSTKVMRAAFLQEKQAGYIEAAKAYGASDWRIIRHYLVPRIIPVILPQIVMLIPSFIFMEATLAIFNVFDTRFPTWGRIIYSALRYGGLYGSQFWVLEPILLMLVTGLAFVLISFGLNRILTPHLQSS